MPLPNKITIKAVINEGQDPLGKPVRKRLAIQFPNSNTVTTIDIPKNTPDKIGPIRAKAAQELGLKPKDVLVSPLLERLLK